MIFEPASQTPRKIRKHGLMRKTCNITGGFLSIYIGGMAYITAISSDNGSVVYSVIMDFLNPYKGGRCAYFEDIAGDFDWTVARLTYGTALLITLEKNLFRTKENWR
ncbi:MAG: hypothetical protein LWX07_01270 [Bacteroidetes bacterium]|nr:hypothetical protein [Bacteroidota bacterium]